MGSGASNQNIPLSHNPLLNPSDEYFNNVLSPELSLEENGWIKISHTYETKDSFSSTTYSIKVDAAASVLSQPEEILRINGCCWKYNLQDDDEDENINLVEYFDLSKKQIIVNKCHQAYLDHKYSENFTKPRDIPSDKVFTCISVLVKSSDNKISSTELSGCIPYSEHLTALGTNQRKLQTNNAPIKEENTEESDGNDALRKGNWSSRLKDLLPGDKFDVPRADIRQILTKLDSILDESLKGINLFRYKCNIYLYYRRQNQAYQHLLQEGITTEKGEKHLREHEHWKKLTSEEIDKMLFELLNTAFTGAESLLETVIPSSSSSHDNLVQSFHQLKTSLHTAFTSDVYSLAELLDQQETAAFEQLNLRFNQPAQSLQPSQSTKDSDEDRSRKLSVATTDSRTPNGNLRKKSNIGNSTIKPVDRRPLSATSNESKSEVPTIPEEKDSPRTERRRKTMDPSQKYGPASTTTTTTTPSNFTFDSLNSSLTSNSTNALLLNGKSGTSTPPSPTNTNAVNHLQVIKNASYHISKNNLFKKFELRKYHQSTQQDKNFCHSIRYEITYFIFCLLIKEAMNNYMIKEYNLLENKLLTSYTKELEELNVFQAKELAAYMNYKETHQQQPQVEEEGNEKENNQSIGEERKNRILLHEQSTMIPESTIKINQFHIPIDFTTIDNVNLMRKKHEEIKIKLENYLSEKRRVKRKAFDDAKNITFEKLNGKLTDIKIEADQGMLSPAGLGKYKTIMKIINILKNNGK